MRRSMRMAGRRPFALLALLLIVILCGFVGCGPSGTGLTDKPPPKGGPPANTRRPPGEVNSPATH